MLNAKNYKEILSGLSLVEIKGDSCSSCITMMPVLSEIAKEKNLNLYFVDASEDNMPIIEEYNVKSVPTILLLHNLELIGSVKGFQPKEILEIWIDSKIEGYIK